MKNINIFIFIFLSSAYFARAQQAKDSILTPTRDSLAEIVISASRIPERLLFSPVSISQLTAADAGKLSAPTCFDALENTRGVQVITPSIGFKVINTRGFANTTNVRFAQLVDGVDNQAPHIGAPIANALGANDLDIDRIEVIPGTASALYGMNAINGLANISTKNPFTHQGLTLQQLTGVNHIGATDKYSPQLFTTTNVRFARSYHSKWAFKVSGSYTKGKDGVADNRTDLGAGLNASTGLTGGGNPATDEVNAYGNESSNRRTLTLNGKQYVVARTGYRETDITDYTIQNYKGDAGIYYRPREGQEISIHFSGAMINNIYQRSNRFSLQDYTLAQYVINYRAKAFEVKAYLTQENTGKSYNIRSLAETMDKAFKPDNTWFTDFTNAFNSSAASGKNTADALRLARQTADNGRYQPGTAAFDQKKAELININNWDIGAALRVQSYMLHGEGLLNWDKLFPDFFHKHELQLQSGFDRRTYIIVPDGNYFINPVDTGKDLTYSKVGGFTQLNKDFFDKRLRLGATVRADYGDYFSWKVNPRITAVYSPGDALSIRASFQSGYRFPSIFEGFSNVISGGVKRVGGLKVMSDGIFEHSWTKASIDAFQAKVNNDVNTLGLTQAAAIAKEKTLLKQNPYTYLQPEYVRSFEFGVRSIALCKKFLIDADGYYNYYNSFIAQVEASIPKTANPDSVATYLYSAGKQDKYRLWTNSKSIIKNYGASLGLTYKYNQHLTLLVNATFSQLDRTENKDGLEDGFNTPQWMFNASVITENIWKHLGAGITYRYQTSFSYVSFLVNGMVPAFWSCDAQFNYTFVKPGIVAKLGATNLFNKPYYSMLGGAAIGGLYYLSLVYTM